VSAALEPDPAGRRPGWNARPLACYGHITARIQGMVTQPGLSRGQAPGRHDPAGGPQSGGHAGHADHAARFRDRFWWSLLPWVPVAAFSHMFAALLGFVPPATSVDSVGAWWAAGYTLLSVPLAAGALTFAGVMYPLAVGAMLMSASALVVAANAQLRRRVSRRTVAWPRR
jgi:hypothetical protein